LGKMENMAILYIVGGSGMRKFFSVLLIICCIAIFSSCGNADRGLELELCGSYAVHGMFCGELRGTESRAVQMEKDRYGRELFAYTAPNLFTDEILPAYVICQKIDSRYVYYYEDICYYIGDSEENALNQLKIQNDWDMPLEEDKLSKRNNRITLDLFISLGRTVTDSDVYELAGRELGVSKEQMQNTRLLDLNNQKQELHMLRTGKGIAQKQYLLLLTSEGGFFWKELPAGIPEAEEIAEFKANGGWNYG